MLVRPQQRLLVDLLPQDFVEVSRAEKEAAEGQVAVDVLDRTAYNQRQVAVAELAETIAAFLERHDQSLVLSEHLGRVFLVALQLSQQNVGLGLLNQEDLAGPEQYLVCLLVRQSQVDEMVHEAAQLVKDQVGILFELDLLLLLPGLHQTLQTFDALFENV